MSEDLRQIKLGMAKDLIKELAPKFYNLETAKDKEDIILYALTIVLSMLIDIYQEKPSR